MLRAEAFNPIGAPLRKTMATKALPSVVGGAHGLSRYLEEIRKFPMLEPGEEYMLAKRWQEHQDSEAAHKLVTSHLRLVAVLSRAGRHGEARRRFQHYVDRMRELDLEPRSFSATVNDHDGPGVSHGSST